MAGIRTLTPTPPQLDLRLMERLADLERRLDDVQRHGSVYVPTGAIIATGGNSADAGFLLCNGAAYSREVYNVLFSRIGTIWGAGNGSTTFNVPNLNNGTFLRAAAASGAFGGAETHLHGMDHTHTYSGTTSTNASGANTDGTGGFGTATREHAHTFSGTTSGPSTGNTGSASHLPPYANVVFQIKV